MIVVKQRAKLSRLIVDKISLTLRVTDEADQRRIVTGFSQLVADKDAYHLKCAGYRESIGLRAGGKDPNKILLQADPRYPSAAFFRLEYNPERANKYALGKMLNRILPNLSYTLFQESKCTRIDLAVDIFGVETDDLLIWAKGARVNRVFSRSGRTESVYLGSRNSAIEFNVYNKRAERAAAGVEIAGPDFPITRVEARVKNAIPMICLKSIANPFRRLHLASFKRLSKKSDVLMQLFLDSCRHRGAKAAMMRLEKPDRDLFEARLHRHQSPWWEPDQIWEGYGSLVEQLFIPNEFYGSLDWRICQESQDS